MNLIMFCANPDFVTIGENNDKNVIVWELLQIYTTIWVGKLLF